VEYGAAAGSAREALACLQAAESVGYLRNAEDDDLRQRLRNLIERIQASLDAGPS
jgi:hypothetical protein